MAVRLTLRQPPNRRLTERIDRSRIANVAGTVDDYLLIRFVSASSSCTGTNSTQPPIKYRWNDSIESSIHSSIHFIGIDQIQSRVSLNNSTWNSAKIWSRLRIDWNQADKSNPALISMNPISTIIQHPIRWLDSIKVDRLQVEYVQFNPNSSAAKCRFDLNLGNGVVNWVSANQVRFNLKSAQISAQLSIDCWTRLPFQATWIVSSSPAWNKPKLDSNQLLIRNDHFSSEWIQVCSPFQATIWSIHSRQESIFKFNFGGNQLKLIGRRVNKWRDRQSKAKPSQSTWWNAAIEKVERSEPSSPPTQQSSCFRLPIKLIN